MIQAYLVSIIAVYLAYLARKEKNKAALPFAFIIITVFLSLGYNWGNDVPTYETWFWSFYGYDLFDFSIDGYGNSDVEPGYIFINLLFRSMGFWGMRAVLFCFENLVIYLLVKRTVPREYYWLALFVYTFNPNFMILGSSMMRQWLAMCIIILGFLFLEKLRWLIYIGLALIAFLIHRSSIICLPLVVLPFLTYKFKKNYLLFVVPILIVYYFLSNYLVRSVANWLEEEDMYTNYVNPMYSTGIGIMSIINLLIYGFLFFNISQIEKGKRIYVAVLIVYALVLPLYNYSGLASRLSYYISMFTICAYPLFLKQAVVDSSVKLTLKLMIFALTMYNNILFFTNPMWFIHFGKYKTLFDAGIITL